MADVIASSSGVQPGGRSHGGDALKNTLVMESLNMMAPGFVELNDGDMEAGHGTGIAPFWATDR